jgi:hypothetical protein
LTLLRFLDTTFRDSKALRQFLDALFDLSVQLISGNRTHSAVGFSFELLGIAFGQSYPGTSSIRSPREKATPIVIQM